LSTIDFWPNFVIFRLQCQWWCKVTIVGRSWACRRVFVHKQISFSFLSDILTWHFQPELLTYTKKGNEHPQPKGCMNTRQSLVWKGFWWLKGFFQIIFCTSGESNYLSTKKIMLFSKIYIQYLVLLKIFQSKKSSNFACFQAV